MRLSSSAVGVLCSCVHIGKANCLPALSGSRLASRTLKRTAASLLSTESSHFVAARLGFYSRLGNAKDLKYVIAMLGASEKSKCAVFLRSQHSIVFEQYFNGLCYKLARKCELKTHFVLHYTGLMVILLPFFNMVASNRKPKREFLSIKVVFS